jgi:hypothetical protein
VANFHAITMVDALALPSIVHPGKGGGGGGGGGGVGGGGGGGGGASESDDPEAMCDNDCGGMMRERERER